MKIAFDEHVPPVIAKVFIALAKESSIQRVSKGLEWERAADYAPKKTDEDYTKNSDVPWLDRFAAAGGRAIISGDVKMRSKPHEKLALHQHGFVVIFFEPQWAQWGFFHKTGLMLHWWGEIISKIRTADRGTFWVVPCSWPRHDAALRNASLGLAKLLKDAPGRKGAGRQKRKRAALRPKGSGDVRQSAFLEALEGQSDDHHEK